MLDDPDPQVRLAACLAWSEMPRTESGEGAALILSALVDPRNQQDRWMGDALTIAAADAPSSSRHWHGADSTDREDGC